MTHVTDELTAYCRGELAPERAQRVAEHVLACPRCRRAYDEVRLGVALVGRLPLVAPPDEVWSRIQGELASAPGAPILPERAGRPVVSPALRQAIAAGVLLALLGGAAAMYRSYAPPSEWAVEALAGAPAVGAERVAGRGALGVGEWLVTDEASRANLAVGRIGTARVEPNTRLRLVASRLTEHRLALTQGTIHAVVTAPPRLFLVETPAALAVDLGCAYTLEVDSAGTSSLHVTAGWVELRERGRESIVPAGMRAEMRTGLGPGTPYLESASPALRRALRRIDFEGGGGAALDTVLAEAATPDHALTLWHLLPRVAGADRVRVYDRLAALSPPPAPVMRDAILRLERRSLARWRESMSPMWSEEAMTVWQRAARQIWEWWVAD